MPTIKCTPILETKEGRGRRRERGKRGRGKRKERKRKERKRNYLHKEKMRGREQVEGHAKYSLLELFPLQ